ncbi:uncharacterized protein LOC132508132 isoform X2 [Lagenorhynchus albirostris]|uniref:uncharacterized protein LOC132508132 isoform X2 n=1 Tax=Lagenorhynchus albirostris TaxID=27610 RepID=UPI0028E2DA58|nr:uncharacterized protein LOC132508132 isoform X2 [Lagenorhynchus albirostris]
MQRGLQGAGGRLALQVDVVEVTSSRASAPERRCGWFSHLEFEACREGPKWVWFSLDHSNTLGVRLSEDPDNSLPSASPARLLLEPSYQPDAFLRVQGPASAAACPPVHAVLLQCRRSVQSRRPVDGRPLLGSTCRIISDDVTSRGQDAPPETGFSEFSSCSRCRNIMILVLIEMRFYIQVSQDSQASCKCRCCPNCNRYKNN